MPADRIAIVEDRASDDGVPAGAARPVVAVHDPAAARPLRAGRHLRLLGAPHVRSAVASRSASTLDEVIVDLRRRPKSPAIAAAWPKHRTITDADHVESPARRCAPNAARRRRSTTTVEERDLADLRPGTRGRVMATATTKPAADHRVSVPGAEGTVAGRVGRTARGTGPHRRLDPRRVPRRLPRTRSRRPPRPRRREPHPRRPVPGPQDASRTSTSTTNAPSNAT